jgi:hypothetical protein
MWPDASLRFVLIDCRRYVSGRFVIAYGQYEFLIAGADAGRHDGVDLNDAGDQSRRFACEQNLRVRATNSQASGCHRLRKTADGSGRRSDRPG